MTQYRMQWLWDVGISCTSFQQATRQLQHSRRGVAAEQVTPLQLKEARYAVVCTPSYLCHSLNLGLEA